MSYLDLNDIQGNVTKGYGRYGYPVARYFFVVFTDTLAAQRWLGSLLPHLTTAAPWPDPGEPAPVPLPETTLNIALTYQGLKALGLPRKALSAFPEEFQMGMKARVDILGDDGPSAPEHWDPIWQDGPVHAWLSINARNRDALAQRTDWLLSHVEHTQGAVVVRNGHRSSDGTLLPWQEAGALTEQGKVTPKEHFGFVDGISDPYFKGCGSPAVHVIGGGKPTREDPSTVAGWEPLETGEFVLGYRDEAYEYPAAPVPSTLARNGTFMVYRKLHQNVATWRRYTATAGKNFPAGQEKLEAKMVGRWHNGAPLAEFPTKADADAFSARLVSVRAALKTADNPAKKAELEAEYAALRQKLTGFNYENDLSGSGCPVGAHVRRANPRGALEFGNDGAFQTKGALVNRRRLLRRGLPYGTSPTDTTDADEHGIVFMALNANIERQFEFVQQQWINYGNDFKLGNERDPVIGNQPMNDAGFGNGHMMIPNAHRPPHFCTQIPRFVETRGGEYFFIPSLSALHMMAQGLVDPT
ncbi:Dyp-type peroxidase [Salinispirillum marinum]|uniref:Dyp-type peroxidase n=2 Tax=Saccharospirillaceae TaxID=255527 RepID=A0ABV8BBH4_9GAMM